MLIEQCSFHSESILLSSAVVQRSFCWPMSIKHNARCCYTPQISPFVSELALYDIAATPGVAADISHINSRAKTTVCIIRLPSTYCPLPPRNCAREK